MEKEMTDEFNENEYRETIKLNELMQDLKLEEENEEDEIKKLEEVVQKIDKMNLNENK